MSQFISHLADYLKTELQTALATAPNAELRVFFAGPPLDVLAELLEFLIGDSDAVTFVIAGNTVRMPVLLVDGNATNPEHLCSGRCTINHLVKVRTSWCSTFLALLPPDELTNLSIDSTMTWIGFRGIVDGLEDWLRHPLIDRLVDVLLRKYSHAIPQDKARDALESALREAWQSDERHKDHRNTWRILRRLFDSIIENETALDAFLATLGLPKCEKTEVGSANHLKALERLSVLLESSGLSNAFAALEEQAGEHLKSCVHDLGRHLMAQCSTATDFALRPLSCYSPIKNNATASIPNWWTALTMESWNDLLDSPEAPQEDGIVANLSVQLTPTVKGMPFLLEDRAEFSVQVSTDIQITITISRAIGSKAFEVIDSICCSSGVPVIWEDASVPIHERHIRYRFEAPGFKPATKKVIVLNHYVPGVAVYCRNATSISPFKLNKKGRNSNNTIVELYECEVRLNGVGTHQVDLYKGSDVILSDTAEGYEVNSGNDGTTVRRINLASDNHAVCVLETDEECHYDFRVHTNGEWHIHRVWITADDELPVGASSEFDRLIIEHRNSVSTDKIGARVEPVPSRLTDLQIWAIDSDESFNPVVLGPDYLDSWRKPLWSNRTESILSQKYKLLLDPRPTIHEFVPPEALIKARLEVLDYFRGKKGEQTIPLEMHTLGTLCSEPEFESKLKAYIKSYLEWLESDYTSAAWMDVVSIHRCEEGGGALSPIPYALLLSPIHPVRLAWQCRAQKFLKEALDAHVRCPAASILDPYSSPDCMQLPCRMATGHYERRGFLAVTSSSPYWGVLWNKDAVGDLASASRTIFDRELGVLVEGLAAGFSVQQVVRSLDEVKRLASGKALLKVSITSDTTGSSCCNEGVEAWCMDSLGGEQDEWYSAGPVTLHVYDRRAPTLHPEQAALASLTARTGATVRWFTQAGDRVNQRSDLAVVAHLGVSSPGFQIEKIRSAVDPTGLTRWRIRKQLAATDGAFIAESRIGSFPASEDREDVQGLLIRSMEKLENSCKDIFDCYIFAPQMPTLYDALESASYCAVSSSSVDAACFFGKAAQSYLWDYELPSYSRQAGNNNGYYLLAKESTNMVRAVQSAARMLGESCELSSQSVSSLLREISKRGMPTLKRLTGGGAMSLGEVGMLVALRVLQSEFEDNPHEQCLIPVRSGEVLNLVIPADPFAGHYESLRSALPQESKSAERPDILIVSILFAGGQPLRGRITPVEVKARGSVLGKEDRHSALNQARSFAQFLLRLQGKGAEVPIWRIAWRSMLSSWLDYAFRVYGQLKCFQNAEWSELHYLVLSGVMSEDLEVEIEPRGRLIVIDDSEISCPNDVDGDGYCETICLSHADAYAILASQGVNILSSIRSKLLDWETSSPAIKPKPSLHPPVSGSQEPTPPPADSMEIITSTGIQFCVGQSMEAFTERGLSFYPGNTNLNQLNVGIVGDLGTGKTQLIQALIYQMRKSPLDNRGVSPKILIFDYKKDYSKAEFVNAVGARVVKPFNIPLNFFDTTDSIQPERAWLERSKFFSDTLDKIYSGIGPVQRTRIKQAIQAAYKNASEHALVPTIYDVYEAYQGVCGKQLDSPYAIMSDLVDGEYFARDACSCQPFSEFLDGVVVVDLADVGQDDRTKNILVVVFLNLFYEHMLKIKKQPFVGNDPQTRFIDTMLLVDEADNIMQYEFDVLRKLLLQGREFGVGVILASQYLSHFRTKNTNYREPLLTWFVHKVPEVTVKDLEGIGLTYVDADTAERIKSLACHECFYKTFDVPGEFMRALPFYKLIT